MKGEDLIDLLEVAWWLFVLFAWLAGWGLVIFVAYHFIHKWW